MYRGKTFPLKHIFPFMGGWEGVLGKRSSDIFLKYGNEEKHSMLITEIARARVGRRGWKC